MKTIGKLKTTFLGGITLLFVLLLGSCSIDDGAECFCQYESNGKYYSNNCDDDGKKIPFYINTVGGRILVKTYKIECHSL